MIKILSYTPNPLTLMGTCAKECWNSNPKDLARVAKECIESGHGRVLEFGEVIVAIDGYSARAIRELYTHIIGTTRLQSSTRYIEYGEFDYFTPSSIQKNDESLKEYNRIMDEIKESYIELQKLGIPKEDIANILPLGMISRMVLKINVRALMHLAEMRLCTRAYSEIRTLTRELLNEVSKIDDEWKYIASICQPKCKVVGYCTEKFSCGMMPKKDSTQPIVRDIKSIKVGDKVKILSKNLIYSNYADFYKKYKTPSTYPMHSASYINDVVNEIGTVVSINYHEDYGNKIAIINLDTFNTCVLISVEDRSLEIIN
jgi:thymidylate synthase (FAD)